MKIEFQCQYCGHSWTDDVYFTPENTKCKKCDDKNVKLRKYDDTSRDVFGYDSDAPKKDAWIKR